MVTVDHIKALDKYTTKVNNKIDRGLIDNYEFEKDNYSVGSIMNSISNDLEVYCYLINNQTKEVVSNLKYKLFSKQSEAKEYFKDVTSYLEVNNLEKITKFLES